MRVMLWALHFAEYASLLSAALQKHAEVFLVVYADNAANELGPEFRTLIAEKGVSLEVLQRPRAPLDVFRNAMALLKASKRFRPDLLHIQEDGRDEMVLARMMCGRMPHVLTVHDPAPHSGRDAQRYRFSRVRLYHAILRRRAAFAITHGQALREELARVSPRLGGRCSVIAHGPLGLLNKIPPGRRQPNSPARLLFFGRIHAYKGLRYFVEAVRALHEQGNRVLGIVAGQGSDLEQFRQEMLEAGCFDIRDRYIGSDEVVELFLSTDVVVLPYTDASQSGVAAMALGYGIPVVATSVGSIPEFVRDGVNGYLVPARNSAAVATAVQEILKMPGEYERLSKNAIALRDGELSWCRIAEQTMDCYRKSRNLKLR